MPQVASKTSKQNLKIPKRFEVILLNDDYTTMEFVIEVLRRFFYKEFQAAEAIMLKIHIDGEAVCPIKCPTTAYFCVDELISNSDCFIYVYHLLCCNLSL